MGLRLGKVCRGKGVAYIECYLDGVSSQSSVGFVAVSELNVDLPIESYRVEDANCEHHYILATPLLDTQSVTVIAKVVSDSSVFRLKKSISRTSIKWLSRLNYKLDFDKTNAIRDTDNYQFTNQIHVKPELLTIADKKNQYVIKGVACSPDFEEKLDFRLLDESGNVVEEPSIYFGRSSRTSKYGLTRKESSFTLRLPRDGITYCLVVSGHKGSRAGFLCLDKASLEFYQNSIRVYAYRGAADDIYSLGARGRQRLVDSFGVSSFIRNDGPKFSIVVPLYNTPVAFLNDLVSSVSAQLYQDWELILVNSTPNNLQLANALHGIQDARVRILDIDDNKGISENTNVGIRAAVGDFIVFADHDDVIDRMALLKYADAITRDSSIDVLYSDEDLLDLDGNYVNPHFKSDFNIDLLRCHNYITHLLCVRSSLVADLPLRKEFDGAQDYDFLLRLTERTSNFYHVRDVLYHWRMSETSTAGDASNKTYAEEAGRKALQEHLNRSGFDGSLALSTGVPFVYKVQYKINGNPLISIVIPNKDNLSVLRRCLDSIFEKTTYSNFEIVIVENNSSSAEIFEYYQDVQRAHPNVRVVVWDKEFNYSAINNYGVEYCNGDYILLLNNDVEVIEPGWLESMLSYCQREDVGAVGAKLLFPDDTIQHAGVMMAPALSLDDCAGPMHVFAHYDSEDGGYFGRIDRAQDLTCVTAACLMVSRDIYNEVNGLNESYAVAYNDVDFCLRLRKAGYLNVYDPEAVLYHYESVTRGYDDTGENVQRFISEQGHLRYEWADYFAKGDPYHSIMSRRQYWTLP